MKYAFAGALGAFGVAATVSCGTTEPATNPLPALLGLNPSTVLVGGPGFPLELQGEGFTEHSRARWNGEDRPTTFVGSTRLTVQTSASDIAATSSVQVTVFSPSPGGGLSGTRTLLVNNPGPQVSSISPDKAVAPAPAFTLTVSGTGFVTGSLVLIGGFAGQTTYVSSTQLRVAVGGLFNPGTIQISVLNPAPGGGVSSTIPFTVEYPLPTVILLEPGDVISDAGQTTLVVTGTGFTSQSVVRFDGTPRPTQFFSDTRLSALLSAADIALTGSHAIAVSNPGPGGGAGPPVLFTVLPAPPRVTSVTPGSFTVGAAGGTITIVGRNFTAGTVVEWNSAPRPTTFLGPTALSAVIPASDLTVPGTAQLAVVNPLNGTRTAIPVPVVVANPGLSVIATVPIMSNDVVMDASRGRFYISVPSGAPAMANTITAITPFGQILFSIPVASNPGRMALLGKYLYVLLIGAPGVVRIDLDLMIKDAAFELGLGIDGPLRGEDIEVLDAATRTVAISRRNTCCSPRHEGVAIYDDGVMRPARTQGHTGSNRITGSGTPAVLFGYNNETTEFGVRRLKVTPTGVREELVREGLIGSFGADIEYADGRIFSTTGAVIDAETLTSVGNLGTSGTILAGQGRVLVMNGPTLQVFAHGSLELMGLHQIPAAAGAATLVRWATTGLILRTADQVVIITSPLLGP